MRSSRNSPDSFVFPTEDLDLATEDLELVGSERSARDRPVSSADERGSAGCDRNVQWSCGVPRAGFHDQTESPRSASGLCSANSRALYYRGEHIGRGETGWTEPHAGGGEAITETKITTLSKWGSRVRTGSRRSSAATRPAAQWCARCQTAVKLRVRSHPESSRSTYRTRANRMWMASMAPFLRWPLPCSTLTNRPRWSL
jgi:hypothetical protein